MGPGGKLVVHVLHWGVGQDVEHHHTLSITQSWSHEKHSLLSRVSVIACYATDNLNFLSFSNTDEKRALVRQFLRIWRNQQMAKI